MSSLFNWVLFNGYTLILYLYLRRRSDGADLSRGFLNASYTIMLLNLGLIALILAVPDIFFI
ncbi:hypothetical protein GCM10008967_31740 [Bacillus carboniphilus]|uniref:Uncharacterized protein n=1 Tax=Bacillus carboniphilus TaxID=86663 RepID=A0ABN0WIN9_9BACI